MCVKLPTHKPQTYGRNLNSSVETHLEKKTVKIHVNMQIVKEVKIISPRLLHRCKSCLLSVSNSVHKVLDRQLRNSVKQKILLLLAACYTNATRHLDGVI